MKRRFLWHALPAGYLLLASCGGVSGDGASPTPTPTPLPTPTPTPITYTAASDFTRDRTFSAAGIRIIIDRSTNVAVPEVRIDPEGTAIGFDFDVATRTYTARYLGDSITAATKVMGDPSYDQFEGTNSTFLRAPFSIDFSVTGGTIGSTYVGYVRWNDSNGIGQSSLGTRTTIRQFLFGARTLSGDTPSSGTPTFNGQSNISGPGGGSGGTGQMSVDFTARKITGTTVFSPPSTGGTGSAGRPSPPPETISFAGTLDPSTGRVSGTATHVLTGATGKFEGALYGPAAAEAAILFVIQRTDNGYYFGAVAGRR